MHGRYQLMGAVMLWALLVPVAGHTQSDPFDLEHDSTPAAARSHCVTTLTECRKGCGAVPTSDPSAMKPWENCLEECDGRFDQCQAAERAAYPDE